MSETVLQVEHLKKYYHSRHFSGGSVIRACDDVGFSLDAGETLGIVGESGCGKSTAARAVIRLIEPDSGSVILDGEDFLSLKGKELKRARQKIKLIFQDPYSSLNPRMTVQELIAEPLDVAGVCRDKKERETRVLETMSQVGLNPAYANRYPHEFSGGQRQRLGIARAIILHPKVIICDEPVSALDVSIQAKIINLLRQLQKDMGLAYIFISHDLGVVRHIADRVLVMYLGRVVEEGTSSALFSHPLHPYTRALLDSVPRADQNRESVTTAPLTGDLPSPANPPSGCLFHTRCPYAAPRCSQEVPALLEAETGHKCACLLKTTDR